MVHSDFIAVHRSMSADANLSQQLCSLRILVRVTRVATQKTSVGRRWPMQNDGSLNAVSSMELHVTVGPVYYKTHTHTKMLKTGN